MILYYFLIAQNTVNKTVSDFFFFRDVNACLCMCTYFTIFLFTGLIPVYPVVRFLESISASSKQNPASGFR